MILINLLPPELRKRQSGVSPMFLSVVAGGGVCALLLLLWLYLIVLRIPNADRLIASKTEELKVKTAEAEKVLQLEKQIAEAKDRYEQIVGMMSRKVYWARTFDEFANLLNGPFTIPNFDVRCLDLTISEASALPGNRRTTGPQARSGEGPVTVAFNVSWRYKLLGKERPLAGDYINSFFATIKASKFWTEQGFTGRPEDTYRGDVPRENKDINRVIIEGDLDWQRVKIVEARPRK
jgi:hypothetical protein